MATEKWSAWASAGTLTGTEKVPMLQGGANVTSTLTALLAVLVAAAPSTLDTLNELAAALGNDPNFATTVTTSLATKVAKSTYDANTILKADTDDTPVALTMAASTFLARLASGSIVAATVPEAKTLLAIAEGDVTGLVADLAAKQSLVETVNTVATSGAAQTIPAPSSATISRITLTANCTLTFPTAAAGASFTLVLVQDATGSRTVTWPGTVKWAGGTAPTLSTGVTKIDYLSFVCTDGTNWAGFVAGLDMR